jgi:hypothetical protein
MSDKSKAKEIITEVTSVKREAKKECFVISPIDKAGSEIRKRSDQVFKHIISATVEPMGYRPIRADQISEPGIITSQIIQHVVDATIVVADLTGRNPNVFYELAIRHAIRKPLVQLITTGESIPFDVAGTRTISIDINDLDSVEQAKKELMKQIESIEKGRISLDSPISVALDLKILRESDNPEQRSLADVVSAISNLRNAVAEMEKRIRHPEELIPPSYIVQCMRMFRDESSMRRNELAAMRARIVHELDLNSEKLSNEKIPTKEKETLAERQKEMLRRLDALEHDFMMMRG